MTPLLHVTYIGHATVCLDMGGVRILTDPVLRDRFGHIRRQGRPVDAAQLDNIDAVLISHMHLDHLDLPSLRALGRHTRIIAPAGCGHLLSRNGFTEVEEVRAGDWTAVGPVAIGATHAQHDGTRYPLGPEADTLGYLLHGPSRVYFAGDTDLFPEMDTLGGIDLALLPVWGWGPTLGHGHLTPERAAESLRLLQPKNAMPIHWGTFAPLGMGWMRPRFLSEPPHRFATHAGRVAPDVDIHVVTPGDFVRFPVSVN